MTSHRRIFSILAGLAVILSICLPASTARSQTEFCAPLRDKEAQGAVLAVLPDATSHSEVQAGLRAFFKDPDRRLNDSLIGPYTVQALARLCDVVPLVAGTEAVSGTVDLARNYGRLDRIQLLWRSKLNTPADLLDNAQSGYSSVAVQLAASPEMAAVPLGRRPADASHCADLQAFLRTLPEDERGRFTTAIEQLAKADPNISQDAGADANLANAVCTLYPVAASAPGVGNNSVEEPTADINRSFVDAVLRLGALESKAPGALSLLGSAGFRAWLAEDASDRLPRLVGSPPSVLTLVDAFGKTNRTGSQTKVPLVKCTRPSGMTDLDYYTVGPEQIAALSARLDLTETLKTLKTERPPSESDLSGKIVAALNASPEGCPAQQIEAVVDALAENAAVYKLDPKVLDNLKADDAVSPFIPLLEQLLNVEAPSKEVFLRDITARVSDVARVSATAQAEAIAKSVSAAAVEIKAGTDKLAQGFPEPDAPPAPPKVALPPDLEDLVKLQATDIDAESLAAIQSLAERPATTRQDLEANVIAELAPRAAKYTQDQTSKALKRLEEKGAIIKLFRLSDEMISNLQAVPQLAAMGGDPATQLSAVEGFEYPFRRLLDRHLETAPVSLDEKARAPVLDVAAVPVADGPRQTGPINIADCGCAAPRVEYGAVYGFYPFWQSDLKSVEASAGDPPAQNIGKVDFELFDRVSFDGLEIGSNGLTRNRDRWTEAAPDFIQSAHRHQSKADVSIRLNDWQGWTDDNVQLIARDILSLMRETAYPPRAGDQGLIPYELNRFLSRKPDGITLVISDFVPDAAANPLKQVILLIRHLEKFIDSEEEFKHLVINLALDIDIARAKSDPSFNPFNDPNLRTILPGSKVQSPLYYLLVFLESDTSASKKALRILVEQSFSGIERIQVLRSIIPVVPSGRSATYVGDETSEEGRQFWHDVLYFQDNFAGIALWPATGVSGDVGIGATLTKWLAPTAISTEVEDDLSGRTQVTAPSRTLQLRMSAWVEPVCNWTCPRRMVVYAAIAVSAGTLALILLVSPFSGFVRQASSKLWLVFWLWLAIVVMLYTSEVCDQPANNWALISFDAVVVLTALIWAYHWYQRREDGPPP